MLNEVPMRGMPMPPTDPLIYRFYELVMINGPAWKALIEEEFGDGIMSAIDPRHDDGAARPIPRGIASSIGMSGKFLPYKYIRRDRQPPAAGLQGGRLDALPAPCSRAEARACPVMPTGESPVATFPLDPGFTA